jgi:hypothetical protein
MCNEIIVVPAFMKTGTSLGTDLNDLRNGLEYDWSSLAGDTPVGNLPELIWGNFGFTPIDAPVGKTLKLSGTQSGCHLGSNRSRIVGADPSGNFLTGTAGTQESYPAQGMSTLYNLPINHFVDAWLPFFEGAVHAGGEPVSTTVDKSNYSDVPSPGTWSFYMISPMDETMICVGAQTITGSLALALAPLTESHLSSGFVEYLERIGLWELTQCTQYIAGSHSGYSYAHGGYGLMVETNQLMYLSITMPSTPNSGQAVAFTGLGLPRVMGASTVGMGLGVFYVSDTTTNDSSGNVFAAVTQVDSLDVHLASTFNLVINFANPVIGYTFEKPITIKGGIRTFSTTGVERALMPTSSMFRFDVKSTGFEFGYASSTHSSSYRTIDGGVDLGGQRPGPVYIPIVCGAYAFGQAYTIRTPSIG